jgi:hypothetical protein
MFFPNDVSRDWSGIIADSLEVARKSYWVAKGNPERSFEHWKLLLRYLLSRYPNLVTNWKNEYFVSCIPVAVASASSSAKETAAVIPLAYMPPVVSGGKRGRASAVGPIEGAPAGGFASIQVPPKKKTNRGPSALGSLPGMFAAVAQNIDTNKTLRHFPTNKVIVMRINDVVNLSYKLHDLLTITDLKFTTMMCDMFDRYYDSMVRSILMCEHEATDVACSSCPACSHMVQCDRHVDPKLGQCSVFHCSLCLIAIQSELVAKRTECMRIAEKADAAVAIEAQTQKTRAALLQSIEERKLMAKQYIEGLELSAETHSRLHEMKALLKHFAESEYDVQAEWVPSCQQ